MTIRELITRYLQIHMAPLKSRPKITAMLRDHFGPLHDYELSALKRMDVIQWHQAIGVKYPSQANQCLSQLRCMYNCAIDWGLHDGLNPVVRIKRYKLKARERFVQPNEMGRLQAELHTKEPRLQAYFSLLLLCGARRNEALNCRWEDLDFTTKLWRKHNTKIDQVQMVPVPVGLLTAIGLLPRCCEYVFHGCECGTHMSITNIEKHWRKIRAKAGIDDVRIHDLRRTCASWLAIHGANLAVIQNVLGHTNLTHTAIYARLNTDTVRHALEQHAQQIAAMPAGSIEIPSGSGSHLTKPVQEPPPWPDVHTMNGRA